MELLKKARLWLNDQKPFVIYRKPGSSSVTGIFQRGKVSHGCNKFCGPGFVFAPFDGNSAWILPESDSDMVAEDFKVKANDSVAPEFAPDADAKQDFEQLVAKAVAEIKAGAFEKVVLSRSENVKLKDFDAIAAFENLAGAYPAAFVYLWFHPETDIWMAATPETLLKANGTGFSTMALAGTQAFHGESDVSWPEKEMEEQRFVTDYIWNNLEPITSEIELSAPYTTRAGNLLHIRTDIKGRLSDASDISKVVSILHPTPAVCGLPKQEALNFIRENEGYDREFYAGFLGEIELRGKTDLYVNLRCMKVSGDSATLFMGCGITRDSVAEKEFMETVNKSLTVRKGLGTL